VTAVHGITVAADVAAWERIGLRVVDGESDNTYKRTTTPITVKN